MKTYTFRLYLLFFLMVCFYIQAICEEKVCITEAWKVESDHFQGHLGSCVAGAGDVNGDGYSDVIAGAPYYSSVIYMGGVAFMYYGSAAGLATYPNWMGEGTQTLRNYGREVASVGDVNGDGYSDIAVAENGKTNDDTTEGVVYVHYGSASGAVLDPSWMGEGNKKGAYFGSSVAGSGDVNGDGFDDLIVASHHYKHETDRYGIAWFFTGSDTGLNDIPIIIDDVNRMGEAAAFLGDVNGDGYDDIGISGTAYSNGEQYEGVALVYLGSMNGISKSYNWKYEPNIENARLGYDIASAGDVNGDGFDDLLVSSESMENDSSDKGVVFCFYGSSSGLPEQPDWKTANPLIGGGYNRFGRATCCVGDINADGYSDILIGAPTCNSGEPISKVYLFCGSAEGLSDSAYWIGSVSQANCFLGGSMSPAGDVNGDGIHDFIVGADYYADGQEKEGAVFCFYGDVAVGNDHGITNSPGKSVSVKRLAAHVILTIPDKMNPGCIARIYDLKGSLINTLTVKKHHGKNMILWNYTTGSGEKASKGSYLLVVMNNKNSLLSKKIFIY